MRYLTERAPIGVAFIFGVLATLGIGLQSNAFADEASAKATLKAMSDYIASQKSVSAKYNTELEVITPDIEKITFSSTGDILLSRPDKVRATRTGGYADIELFFDGKTFNVYGKHLNSFFRLDAPGTIDNLIDELREKHGAALPFADLLLSNPYKVLIEGVLEAKDIGHGVIDGVECQHLAFRNEDVDWQLWVQLGANPIPRQYIITSKTVASAPQYRIRISDWKTDVAPANDAFVFKAPDGAKAVSAEAIRDFDELPAPAATARGK
jgi:hypothetical protein